MENDHTQVQALEVEGKIGLVFNLSSYEVGEDVSVFFEEKLYNHFRDKQFKREDPDDSFYLATLQAIRRFKKEKGHPQAISNCCVERLTNLAQSDAEAQKIYRKIMIQLDCYRKQIFDRNSPELDCG